MYYSDEEPRAKGSSCCTILGAFLIASAFMIMPVKTMINLSCFWPGYLYGIMSFLTYCYYCYDKRQAESGGWRVNEIKLHSCGIFFGWPGALMAQWIIRHKIHKDKFQWIFWISGVLHQVFWYYNNHSESFAGRACNFFHSTNSLCDPMVNNTVGLVVNASTT